MVCVQCASTMVHVRSLCVQLPSIFHYLLVCICSKAYSGGVVCLSFVGLLLLSVCLGAQSLSARLKFILG